MKERGLFFLDCKVYTAHGRRTLLDRSAALGTGRGNDCRQNPLGWPPRRLPGRQCRRSRDRTPADPQRHPGSRSHLCPARYLLQPARARFPGSLSPIHLPDGSALHRFALLLPRRPGKLLPLLLSPVPDLLRDPPLVARHLRYLCPTLGQLQHPVPGLAGRPAAGLDPGAHAGSARLGDLGE